MSKTSCDRCGDEFVPDGCGTGYCTIGTAKICYLCADESLRAEMRAGRTMTVRADGMLASARDCPPHEFAMDHSRSPEAQAPDVVAKYAARQGWSGAWVLGETEVGWAAVSVSLADVLEKRAELRRKLGYAEGNARNP